MYARPNFVILGLALGMGCPGTEMFMISTVVCPIVEIDFVVDLLDIRWSIHER